MPTKNRGIRALALLRVALPLVGLMAALGLLVSWRARVALETANASELKNLRGALRELVRTGYELTVKRVASNLEVLTLLAGDTATLAPAAPAHVTVTDQLTGAKHDVDLPALALAGKPALGNDALVDAVSARVGGAATLFQLIPGGMLRVATSVRKADGTRASLTFIPASSPVYKAIVGGERYQGRALVAGEQYVTAYRPVRDPGGAVVGALFVGLPQTQLAELRERVAQFRVGTRGFVEILDGDGKQIVHPEAAREGTVRTDAAHVRMLKAKEGTLVAASGPDGRRMIHAFTFVPELNWLVVVCADQEDLGAPLAAMRLWLAAMLIVAMALSYLLATRFARMIARTVVGASAMLRDMARGAGDLTRRLEPRGAAELVVMATDFNDFVARLQATVREVATSAGDVATSAQALTQTAAAMDATMGTLRDRSDAIAGSSAQATRSVETVSRASTDFASSIGHAAAAIGQMGSTLRSVSDSCGEEVKIAFEARAQAQIMTEVMGQLSTAAHEVGQTLRVIKRIASQTNLLALNATIEAASAGAAGKGFRIVAAEVKALARETAEAAGHIDDRVEKMLAAAAQASTSMAGIRTVIERVDELAGAIGHSIEEQSQAVGVVAQDVAGLDRGATQIAGSASGSAAALARVTRDMADVDRDIASAAEGQRALRVHIEELAAVAQELERVAGTFRT